MRSLREALDRTLLLMRDELSTNVTDAALLDALLGTEIALVADRRNLQSHSAQSAFVTAALLMARSGHRVHLIADDIPMVGSQPPLPPGGIVSSLRMIGTDLLPGVQFSTEKPKGDIDLAILLGNTDRAVNARRSISLNANAWAGRMSGCTATAWSLLEWPFGGLTAGVMVSAEAFKIAMRKLRAFAKAPRYFDALFADALEVEFQLAPSMAPCPKDLRDFDLISAGAIINCALFAVSRILSVRGSARVVDFDVSDLSNLNRNALLLQSQVGIAKASVLGSVDLGDLRVRAVPGRFGSEPAPDIDVLASRVMVGVDDIPSRWKVQRANPAWLGIGASSHWGCMASYHSEELACAGCLHPEDDPTDAPIPTVAFVSFWAGLLLAAYFVRAVGDQSLDARAQQIYFSPLRPERPWWLPVPKRADCPVRQHAQEGNSTSQLKC